MLCILQEVLINIIKHSGATAIRMALSLAGDGAHGVQVCVRDNGDRFAVSGPGALIPERRGLANARSRAQALGAHCAWQPHAHSGGTY